MFSIKASLILLVVSVFFVRSSQAQTNISAAEAEAGDASAKQWLGRQNIGRAGGSACANDKCVEACDKGWEKLGDHCYRWVNNLMNWTAAEDFCQEEGGHLASVGSNETMDNIMYVLRRGGFGDNDYFWLGGNDLAKEGVWEWTDCTPWEFSLWLPEEPSNWNGIEHCVAFRVNNRWNAARLSAGARPLCSKKICSDKDSPSSPVNAPSSATNDGHQWKNNPKCVDGGKTTLEDAQLFPLGAYMSSARLDATKCIDGNMSTICFSLDCSEKAPWIALQFYGPVEVSRVDIYNVENDASLLVVAARTRNLEIRLTDELPASKDQMYAGGQLLGTFQGPASTGQVIKVRGPAKTGKYVLVQMNNSQYCLHLNEVEVFGCAATKKAGETDTLLIGFISLSGVLLLLLILLTIGVGCFVCKTRAQTAALKKDINPVYGAENEAEAAEENIKRVSNAENYDYMGE